MGELERHSVRLTEFRRSGKTTLLRLAEQRAPRGWICVRTSVQDARSASDLVDLTLEALHKHMGRRGKLAKALKALVEPVEDIHLAGVTVALRKDLRGKSVAALRSVLGNLDRSLEGGDARLAIMWDEFPDAIESIAQNDGVQTAKDTLNLLRALRESDDSQRVRWVLTGSVGFHHVTARLGGAGAINDLGVVELPPLSGEWSRWLAESLLLGIGLKATIEQADALARVSGGIPFVLELLVKHLSKSGSTPPPTAAAAEQLLRDAASDVALGANWTPLLDRVDTRYGDRAAAAEDVLDFLARAPAATSEVASLLTGSHGLDPRGARGLLDLLCEDHYLAFDPDTSLYWWRHPPLRIIWQARRRGARAW
ncbi:MAG: hypothetical protein LBG60_03580 [Bifidobacteriaceae bacterium]|nr:hypothetical protein [Bifidobacteriaceae bacterium]